MTDTPKPDPDLTVQLASVTADLAEEQETLRQRQDELRQARLAETDAVNRVNQAQALFDRLVREIRQAAPDNTDWRRSPRYPISQE